MSDHLDRIPCAILLGKSGWRSEHQSRLPPLLQNVVCGLSFSRSQPDFEGFLRALQFPPSSKSTLSPIHLAVVLCSKVTHMDRVAAARGALVCFRFELV